jgi:hypothetical protein
MLKFPFKEIWRVDVECKWQKKAFAALYPKLTISRPSFSLFIRGNGTHQNLLKE